MRRSARVRSSNRREAERDDVQLEETLRRIFPSTLLYVSNAFISAFIQFTNGTYTAYGFHITLIFVL